MARRCRFGHMLFVMALAVLWGTASVRGEQPVIAVMPVEDLSQGINGYSQAMTANISSILRDRGATVVPEEAVMDFMVKNRIRWLGYLDAQLIAKAKEKMGVDIIVLASVNQRREANPPALGITLQMVQAADARVVWAGGSELCRADVRKLLGLAEPQTIKDVEKLVVAQVVANLPEKFVPQSATGAIRQVDSVQLSASVLRPGETVACRIKFSGQEAPKCEDVVVLVGDREIPVTFREREHYYEAVWPAEPGEGPVAVTLKVGGKLLTDQQVFVGSYTVDNQPPKMILQAAGPQLDGRAVVRESVSLMPVLIDPEPIKRWRIEVIDLEGKIIMNSDGEGLPDRFLWRGQTGQGGLVPDGIYTVILTIWDRAGNSVASRVEVEVLRRPPPVTVALKKQNDGVLIELGYDDRAPIAHWRAEVVRPDGGIIVEKNDESLPVQLFVPQEITRENAIRLTVFVQDIFGNQVKRVVQDIGREAKAESSDGATASDEAPPAAGWVEDF